MESVQANIPNLQYIFLSWRTHNFFILPGKSKRLIMETKVPMPMTVVDPDKMFGQDPAQVQCSNCHQVTTTRVESSVRSEGWMFLLLLFLWLLAHQSPGVLSPRLQAVLPLLPPVQCYPRDREAQPLWGPHRPHQHPLPHHHCSYWVHNLRKNYTRKWPILKSLE